MPSEEKVLELVGHIYDAAADEQHWPAFLESLADAISATATDLVYHDLKAPRATLLRAVRIEPDAQVRYMEYYGSFDPHRAAWLTRFSRAGPETICTGEQLIPEDEFKRTEYFNDFFSAYNIFHQLCTPIAVSASSACNLSCHRPASKKPFARRM